MIRDLNEHDLDAFIRIRKDSLNREPMSFGADPNKEIDRSETLKRLKEKNEENFILGYYDQDQLAGMLGFIRYTNAKTKHKAFIWGVFVRKEYRGKQIGRQLMQTCIEKAYKIPGLQKILLGASHISDAAIGLYQEMGFKTYGTEQNAMIWKGEYIHEILMEKKLE